MNNGIGDWVQRIQDDIDRIEDRIVKLENEQSELRGMNVRDSIEKLEKRHEAISSTVHSMQLDSMKLWGGLAVLVMMATFAANALARWLF